MTHQTVLSVDDVAKADQATLKRLNIDEITLIDRVAQALFKQFKTGGYLQEKPSVLVLAGPGNNGADALMFAHYLKQHLSLVTTVYLGNEDSAASSVKHAISHHDEIVKLAPTDSFNHDAINNTYDIVIDGLFGINLTRPLSGVYQEAVNTVNALNTRTISIDIPSGLNARNGLAYADAIKADETYVIYPFKPGNFLQDAADYHGQIHVIDVGIKPTNDAFSQSVLSIDKPTLKPRCYNTHKYDYGMALVIGGHQGMEGAPYLSAKAALRAGMGLVKIAYDPSAKLVPTTTPEIQKHIVQDVQTIYAMLDKVDVVIFGVGLGRDKEAYITLLKHIIESKKRVVVDADGLHYLKPLLNTSLDFSRVVITPHIGELAQLHDVTSNQVKAAPLEYIHALTKHGLTVLLKGVTNIVATKDHLDYIPVKLPALAKAGSGDVLSGLIAPFMMRTPFNAPNALIQAVMFQTYATKHVLNTKHEATILPTDIIRALSSSLNVVK